MKFIKKLNRVDEAFCAVSLIIMVIINFGNVLSRYILHMSWSFTEELLMIFFVWFTMLGTVVGFKRGSHLGLSVLAEAVPTKVRVVFVIISLIATCALMVLLIQSGIAMIQMQMKYSQTTPVMNIPEPLAAASIPVCSALVILRLILYSINEIKKLLKGAAEK